MKFRSLRHYINEAFRNLFRNRLMTLASIITVFSCIFILAFSYCMVINVDNILKQMEESLSISVYIYDDVPQENIDIMNQNILAIPHVEAVDFITKEDALDIFADIMGDSPEAQAGIDELAQDNPLPRSFVVTVDDIDNQDEVVAELEKMRDLGIDTIQYDQALLNIVASVNTGIRVLSVIMILVLVIVSIVIIMNTIKIAVNSRRTEITIMKYIGATDWFIRWPFIVEGILIGLIGSFTSVVICWFGYSSAVETLQTQFRLLNGLFKPHIEVFAILFPLCIMIGIAIGVVGSVTSIRKHLKV